MKKNGSIELLRIVAIFFVIFNHTWNRGWTLFATYPAGSFQFFFYMPIAVFCKFSVPVFFMISGALLLDKEETTQSLKKRIIRMIIVLFLVSLLYYVYDALMGNVQIASIYETIVDYLCKLLSGSTKYNLGFLYSYIAFLLILPFLRILAKNIKNNNIYIYILTIAFALMIFVPLIEQLIFIGTKVTSAFSILTSNIIVYPFLGYFIYNKVDLRRNNHTRFIAAWCCNILFIILSCILTYLRIIKTNEIDIEHIQAFFNTFVIVNASVVFITFLRIHITSGKIYNLICRIGSCVFGVYLLHPFIMDSKLFSYILKISIKIVVNPMLGVLLACNIVLCICIIISYILKKIPGIKKYI